MRNLTCLTLNGLPRDLGLAHGAAHGSRIHAFLNDRFARVAALNPDYASWEALLPQLNKYADCIRTTLPDLWEELVGLSIGAGIKMEEAVLLQVRRELVGFQKVPATGDCTTFVHRRRNGFVCGQTVDLSGHMETEISALRVMPGKGRIGCTLMSFTGLTGYLGMNDAGLCIGLNLVLGGEWRPGIPGYMAIRHLLDKAQDAEDALALLRTLPLASSRSLTLADAQQTLVVEYLPGEFDHWRMDQCVHTNHFLSPMFRERDCLNTFARTSSVRRLSACQERLDSLSHESRAEHYLDMLGASPVYVRPNGDIRRDCTVGAALMFPSNRALHVVGGHPAHGMRLDISF
jgi:isopenicillin-N N-acyltransferase-like protein